MVEGAGLLVPAGKRVGLAERLRFLIANPALREAAAELKKAYRGPVSMSKITQDIEHA